MCIIVVNKTIVNVMNQDTNYKFVPNDVCNELGTKIVCVIIFSKLIRYCFTVATSTGKLNHKRDKINCTNNNNNNSNNTALP